MNDYRHFRTPYEAFVHRAWKAAILTGAEQFLLVTNDAHTTAPKWVDPQSCFHISASTIRSDPPFSTLSGSFCDLNAVPMNLPRQEFSALLGTMTPLLPTGSTLVFEYSTEQFSYREIEQLLSSHGYLIYEHLHEDEIREQFLLILACRRPKISVHHRCYCLAVKYRELT